jgi:hypothetical protein
VFVTAAYFCKYFSDLHIVHGGLAQVHVLACVNSCNRLKCLLNVGLWLLCLEVVEVEARLADRVCGGRIANAWHYEVCVQF